MVLFREEAVWACRGVVMSFAPTQWWHLCILLQYVQLSSPRHDRCYTPAAAASACLRRRCLLCLRYLASFSPSTRFHYLILVNLFSTDAKLAWQPGFYVIATVFAETNAMGGDPAELINTLWVCVENVPLKTKTQYTQGSLVDMNAKMCSERR